MSEEYPMTRTAIQFLRRWSPWGLGDFPLGDPGPPPLAQATGAPRPRIGHPRHPQADQGAPLRLTAAWLEPRPFPRKELAMERLGSAGWEEPAPDRRERVDPRPRPRARQREGHPCLE